MPGRTGCSNRSGTASSSTVTLEQVSYFATPELDDLRPGRFPVWIWMDDPSFYGFPEFGVTGAFKAAEDCGGAPVDPDDRSFAADPVAEARLGAFVAGLVGDRQASVSTTTCLYTLTADRDFVVDRLARRPADLRRARRRPRLQVRRLVRERARCAGERCDTGAAPGAVLDHPRGAAPAGRPRRLARLTECFVSTEWFAPKTRHEALG